MIVLESKRDNLQKIVEMNPKVIIADITINSNSALRKLSPSFEWGNILVPYTDSLEYVPSVEAVWNELRITENDTDGFKRGCYDHVIFDYIEARKKIFIPTYRWMLENKAAEIIKRMRIANRDKTIVLYDGEDNYDIDNPSKPLSHAYLVKAYVEGLAPYEDVVIEKARCKAYYGRRIVTWITTDYSFKEIPPRKSKDPQLTIEFDN